MSEIVLPRSHRLLESYYSELRAFARRKLGNTPTADDVVQEACLRLSGLDGQAIENPRAYLYRVVGNLVIDHHRRENVRARKLAPFDAGLPIADPAADSEAQLVERQRMAILQCAIDELPPRCRECFVMRRFDDLPQEEIARRMGISRNMVEKHLRHAITHCARRLREAD